MTPPKKRKTSPSSELVPAWSGELVIEDDMNGLAEQLVDQARADGIALTGEGGLLRRLIARVLETGLAVEMTGPLGYELNAAESSNTGNSGKGLLHGQYK